MKRYLILVADGHAGHRLGLLNPDTTLYEEDEEGELLPYKPPMTETQKYLWTLQSKAIERAKKIVGADPAMLLFVGDACNGNKYPQQLVSTRISDQVLIAVDNAKPWLDSGIHLDGVRVVKGTAAHNLGEGALEELVAAQLATLYPNLSIRCLYHGLLSIGGSDVDYAHHGPGLGIRNWTRENVARFYLRSMITQHAKRFKVPPALVVRAHCHTFAHFVEFDEINGKRMQFQYVALPSMCGFSEHAIQATQSSSILTNGVVLVEFDEGAVKVIPLTNSVDIRTKERWA